MSMHTRVFFLIWILTALVFTAGCDAPEPSITRVRNVIILIGDGMGTQQMAMLNAYAKYAPESIYIDTGRITALERAMAAGTTGLAYCEPLDVLVADSAAS